MAVVLLDRVIGDRRVRAIVSERSDGDFHPHRVAPSRLAVRQRALIGRPFSMVDQVHGVAVLRIEPEDRRNRRWPVLGHADVIVSDAEHSTPVGVWAADCAPIALFGSAGSVVGVHAGWRGLAAGVVDVGIEELSHRGEAVVAAVVGAMIHPECYAFGDVELAEVADGVGTEVARITGVAADGRRALDVPAAIAAALGRRGIVADVLGACTGCDRRWYSHRVRADLERHVLVAWTEPAHATVGP